MIGVRCSFDFLELLSGNVIVGKKNWEERIKEKSWAGKERKGKGREERKRRRAEERKGSGGTLYRLCSRRNHNKIQNKNLFLSFRKTKKKN